MATTDNVFDSIPTETDGNVFNFVPPDQPAAVADSSPYPYPKQDVEQLERAAGVPEQTIQKPPSSDSYPQIAEAYQSVNTPLVERIPGVSNALEHIKGLLTIGESPYANVPERVLSGVAKGVINVGESFTSPLGIATLGTGALPAAVQRTLSGAFATQMAIQLPQQFKQLKQAVESKDPATIAETATDLGLGAAFTAFAAKHALTNPELPAQNTAQQAYRDQFWKDQAAKQASPIDPITGKGPEQPITQPTEVQNASTIRTDKGVVPETGQVAQAGEAVGGDDVQQKPPQQPEPVAQREEVPPQETQPAPVDVAKPLTFDEFEKQYRSAFDQAMKYGPNEVGSQVFTEKMAALHDLNPKWADAIENRPPKQEAYKAGSPEIKAELDYTNVRNAALRKEASTKGGAQSDLPPEAQATSQQNNSRAAFEALAKKSGTVLPSAENGVVDTIAGKMNLTEFETKGYAPEQVTKQNWIDLQRAERRRLGQNEGGDSKNAPNAEYEEYHKRAVADALKKGEEVDPEVLKDYPDLKPTAPDLNIGRTWDSKYGKQTIVRKETWGGQDHYWVKDEKGNERAYDAPRLEERIKQEGHEITPEYAKEQADKAEIQKLRQERDARFAAKKAATDAEIAEFTKEQTPMAAGKTKAALLKEVSNGGRVITRKALIDEKIANGARVVIEKGKRELRNPDDSFLDESALTKSGMDYAEHRQRLAQETPPPVTAETPAVSTAEGKGMLLEDAEGNYITKEKNGDYKIWKRGATASELAGTVGKNYPNALDKAKQRLAQIAKTPPQETLVQPNVFGDVEQAFARVKAKPNAAPQRIKNELVNAVEREIDKTINDSETTIKPHGDAANNEWMAQNARGGVARGHIEKVGDKFKVTAKVFGHGDETHNASFDSLEDAQWFIKALASSYEGSAKIHIEGGGDFTVPRSGEALVGLWNRARRLNTKSESPTFQAPVSLTSRTPTSSAVITALGSPEKAWQAVMRQLESLTDDPKAQKEARAFADEIYQNTKAHALEVQADTALSTASERGQEASEAQTEIDRINKLKKRNKGHLEDLERLKKVVESATERKEFFERSAETFSQQAAREKAALEAGIKLPPKPPEEPPSPAAETASIPTTKQPLGDDSERICSGSQGDRFSMATGQITTVRSFFW